MRAYWPELVVESIPQVAHCEPHIKPAKAQFVLQALGTYAIPTSCATRCEAVQELGCELRMREVGGEWKNPQEMCLPRKKKEHHWFLNKEDTKPVWPLYQ